MVWNTLSRGMPRRYAGAATNRSASSSSSATSRSSGDEFGLLLHNCPLEKAWQIAESLMERVREFHFLWKGRSFQIGASIGIVPITAEASDATRLLSRADKACYIAKDMGRDRVFVCPADEQAPLQ